MTADRLRGSQNDARVLRDRQAALAADADLARSRKEELTARRRVVQVVNGGSMPSSPDHWFLGRLLDVGGPETEGGSPQTTTVGTATVPFVALHHAPAVGDQVVITAVGGRWVGELTGLPCETTVCVSACAGLPVVMATIAVLDPHTGATLASCTTSTSGCCVLPFCGAYRIQITVSGQLVYDSTRILSGGTLRILLGATAPIVCCGPYAIPTVLTLTDADGSMTFVYDSTWYYPRWTGGHAVTRPSAPVTMPAGICQVGATSDGPVRICYQMICYAGQTPPFAVQRSWSYVYSQTTLQPVWYQDSTTFFPGQPCITAPPPLCGNPLTDTASFNANPSSTNPFVLTGVPVPAPSNTTADPVGGSIVISA